ncbi:MAG: hypothetical protein L0212_06125, partial [Acidobacteria bacterium]|nr:hypothetical protein [Acidobacteriota bacterium]
TGSIVRPSYWSRDGQYLYFVELRESSGIAALWTVWKYQLGVGSTEKVYEGPLVGGGSLFCLSPDDRYLVVAITGSQPGVARVELSTGHTTILAQPTEGQATDPACSPDREWVAFQIQHGNHRALWVVPLAGGDARRLTSGNSEDSHPTWSADSRLVYFLRNHQDIYAVPRAGGEARPVTTYRSFSILLDYPVATHDGRKLLFARNDKSGDIFVLDLAGE